MNNSQRTRPGNGFFFFQDLERKAQSCHSGWDSEKIWGRQILPPPCGEAERGQAMEWMGVRCQSLLTQWMGQKHKKTILHHVYAYKGLNSPKVQDSVAEGRSAEAVFTVKYSYWPWLALLWTAVPPSPWLRISHGCCGYLILTFWTDPHAFRNGFQGWIQAVQVINTRTRVAHEQLATASAHSAEILMDVSLWGRIGPISFPAQLSPTNHLWRGRGRYHDLVWFSLQLASF